MERNKSVMPSFPSQHSSAELFEGGYYSIAFGEGFGIAKILKLKPDKVHVRIYKQRFSPRPRSIDLHSLTLGTIHDKDGFGMGHLPLLLATFQQWEPAFLTYSEVKPEELEGYEVWKSSSNGGVFA